MPDIPIAPSSGLATQDVHIRQLVRNVADRMVEECEVPTAEKVRKRIIAESEGRRNPSALTVQSEMKSWFAESFWPSHHALSAIPEDSEVPVELRRIYRDGYQLLVRGIIKAVSATWDGERRQLQAQVAEAHELVESLHGRIGSLETLVQTRDEALEVADAKLAHIQEAHEEKARQLEQLNAQLVTAANRQAEHERELNQVREVERTRSDEAARQAQESVKKVLLELDTERQASKRSEVQSQQLKTQLRESRDRLAHAHNQLEIQQKDNALLRDQIELMRQTMATLQSAAQEGAKPSVGRARSTRLRLRKNIPSR